MSAVTESVETDTTGSGRKFLPEVQALRALAVLLVIAYHLRPDLVPGGFVGVDVFFVISGYLITGHMIREIRSTGRLRLAHFWGNRARRILPAALLVILLIVATDTFIAPITQWGGLGRQALGSVYYVQNWLLAGDSVNYLASTNPATPFQHFWSLAVEEQFYLLWPFVVVVAVWFAARLGSRRGEGGKNRLGVWLVAISGTLVTASFVWSAVDVSEHDPAAYFATTTRLWELGLGGILAVLVRYTQRRRLLRAGLAVAGLAVIIVVSFVYNADTPFPGIGALPPVLGSAAIIVAGRTSGFGSLTWIVDRHAVQWLGNISYSLYLWHFPIAVDFTAITGRRPTIPVALGLVGVMIIGSAGSYYLVEQRVRKATWARRSDLRALVAAGLAMVVVGASTSIFWIRPMQTEQQWNQASQVARHQARTTKSFGAAMARKGSYRPFGGSRQVIVPDPINAKRDMFLDGVSGRCEPPPSSNRTTRMCQFGNPNASTVIAVVGDSHARMYTPPVLEAARKHGWKVVTFIHTSCPYSATQRAFPDAASCLQANQQTARRIEQLHPAVVVTAFWAGSRFVDDGGRPPGAAGLASAWKQLSRAGSQVLVIKDAPQPRTDVVGCVSQHYDDPAVCATPRTTAMSSHDLVQVAARGLKHVRVLDLTDRFCNAKVCPAVIGDVLVYIDGNHIGKTYADTLLPDIDPALVEAVDRHR